MPPLTNNKEHTWWVMAKPSWSQMIGETQRTIIGAPDAIIDRRGGVEIFEEVIRHGHPRLDERHHLAKGFRCGVNLGAYH